jgi:hypothetical protein
MMKTTEKKIATESGIAFNLRTSLRKQAPLRETAAEKVKITINMENNNPYNGPHTEEELENAQHECNALQMTSTTNF